MCIIDEKTILAKRIIYQIGYGWKPYVGKIYYKIHEYNWPETIVSFCTKQPRLNNSTSEIRMKFETDFPGYELLDIRDIYVPALNQTFYITHVYNGNWVYADEIKKLLTNHPDYELNNGYVII